jgi:hypothetical protein
MDCLLRVMRGFYISLDDMRDTLASVSGTGIVEYPRVIFQGLDAVTWGFQSPETIELSTSSRNHRIASPKEDCRQ